MFVASAMSVTAYDMSSGKLKAEINCRRIGHRPLCPVKGGVLILTNESTVELWSGNLAKRIKRWTNLPGVKQLIPISEERVAVVGEVDVKFLDTRSGIVVSTIPVLQGKVLTCNSKCQLLIVRTCEACPFAPFGTCSRQLLDGETVVWRRKDIRRFSEFDDKSVAFSPMEQFLVVDTIKGEVLTCNSKCQLLIQTTLETNLFLPCSCSLQLLDGKTVVWGKKGIDTYPDDKFAAFSPMEQFLVVSTTNSILVLDPETGNTLRSLGLFSFLRHCTFISEDTCVISGFVSTVRLSNVKSGEILTEIDVESPVICLSACPFNRVLAIGLRYSTPNFKAVRVHLPRGEDRGNMKR